MEESEVPLWVLIANLLPPDVEWFTPTDVAPLVNLTYRAVLKHCRDLWPNRGAQYRLDQSEVARLIKRICLSGRKLPSRAEVLARQKTS